MCGICGISASPDERFDAHHLATAMLLGIEERGRDSTGVAWLDGDTVNVEKDSIAASMFVRKLSVPQYARTFIGHTRWATKGSPRNNDNNHPISTGGIVGIHNGCLSNDDDLFDVIGKENRIAQVDSEAIFAWIQHSGMPVVKALSHLEGSAAIAWFDSNDPEVLNLARVAYSPLIIARTPAGSLLFASTQKCLREASILLDMELEYMNTIEDGTYLQVYKGEVLDVQEIPSAFRSKYRPFTEEERRAIGFGG